MKSKRKKNKSNQDNLKQQQRMSIQSKLSIVELKGRIIKRIMANCNRKNKKMKEDNHHKKNKKIDARSSRARTTIAKTVQQR